LGKKWFAFSKMDIGMGEMLRKLYGMEKILSMSMPDTIILYYITNNKGVSR
jgi:hypothetical protein